MRKYPFQDTNLFIYSRIYLNYRKLQTLEHEPKSKHLRQDIRDIIIG